MMNGAQISYKVGNYHPYDDTAKVTPDWAHKAARGVLADLQDRQVIKFGFQDVDAETRNQIVARLAEIIRLAQIEVQKSAIVELKGELETLLLSQLGSYVSVGQVEEKFKRTAELNLILSSVGLLRNMVEAVNAYREAASATEASGQPAENLNDTYARMLVICDSNQAYLKSLGADHE